MQDIEKLLAALDRFPRVPLVRAATPVRKLSRLSVPGEVWLKDDSATNSEYGGNKPRKLEYLIGAAKARGKAVVTFGFESSNHALATAYHCSAHDVACHLVLVRGPSGMTESDQVLTRQKMERLRALAASITLVDGFKMAAFRGLLKWLRGWGRIEIVPPGGSNALGTLGYVRAGIELAKQIAAGELPEPDLVFVPIGTGGTAAGIAIGLAASGVRSRVIAAKVVPGPVNELPRLKQLARQIGKLVPELPRDALRLENLAVDPRSLGQGYGLATPEGASAVESWSRAEGLKIENTYTGKTAALLETWPGLKRALFWQTYSGKLP